MTRNQLAVLVVFGIIILGLLGAMAWIISGTGLSGFLLAGKAPEEAATVIFLPSYTPRDTNTPPAPTVTATPVSYESLILEGWIQFTYGKAELWMPATFVKQKNKDFLLLAIEKSTLKKNVQTAIGLWKEVVPGMDMDDYLTAHIQDIPSYSPFVDRTFLEQKKIQIDSFESMRVRIESITFDVQAELAIYVLRDDDTFWIISCQTYLDDFRTWLPIFDQVAHTFRVNP